jgi:hypothetical protein
MGADMKKNLLFVYNADSGIFNTVTDIAHKIFSPQSYECNLCAITYGNFTIRGEWKEFLETLDAELEFLHRDEFMKKHRLAAVALPAVFLRCGDELELWISADDLNSCRSVADLKRLITDKMTA